MSKDGRSHKKAATIATAVAEAEGLVPGFRELRIPVDLVPEAQYAVRHLQVQLNHTQAKALARVRRGLDTQGFTLANGRRVTEATDAVRWLLEQIG